MNSDSASAGGQTKNITLGSVLGWIFGVLLLIIGAANLMSNPATGVVILLAAILLLPIFSSFVDKKFNVRLSGALRAVAAIVLCVIAISMSAASSYSEKAAAVANDAGSAGPEKNVSGGASDVASSNQLELISYNCSKDYGYFTIKGQVKNISSQSLKDVEAVGSMYTDDGTFVNSDSAIVKYNPILPGQTSPFEVMSTDNPEATKCKVEFQELFGGTIPTKVDN